MHSNRLQRFRFRGSTKCEMRVLSASEVRLIVQDTILQHLLFTKIFDKNTEHVVSCSPQKKADKRRKKACSFSRMINNNSEVILHTVFDTVLE